MAMQFFSSSLKKKTIQFDYPLSRNTYGMKSGMNMLDSAWNRMVLFDQRENDNTLKNVPFLLVLFFGQAKKRINK